MNNIFNMIKIGFYILFITFNILTFVLMTKLDKLKCKCPAVVNYTNSKFIGLINKVEYIQWFSLIAAIVGGINLFIPFTKTLGSFLLIGSVISILLLIVTSFQLYLLINFLKTFDDESCTGKNKCNLPGFIEKGRKFVIAGSFTMYLIVIAIVVFGMLYL